MRDALECPVCWRMNITQREVSKYPWAITGTAALLGGGIVALAASQDAMGDFQFQYGLLATVRASAVCFLIAFTVGPIYRLTRSRCLQQILANRRYIGLAFAILHTIHLGFIMLWIDANPGLVKTQTLVFGGIAYVFMYAQALTSNNYSVARLGKNWSRLHTFAMYYLWFIMTSTFVGHDYVTARVFTLMFVFAILLRMAALMKKRVASSS